MNLNLNEERMSSGKKLNGSFNLGHSATNKENVFSSIKYSTEMANIIGRRFSILRSKKMEEEYKMKLKLANQEIEELK